MLASTWSLTDSSSIRLWHDAPASYGTQVKAHAEQSLEILAYSARFDKPR